MQFTCNILLDFHKLVFIQTDFPNQLSFISTESWFGVCLGYNSLVTKKDLPLAIISCYKRQPFHQVLN